MKTKIFQRKRNVWIIVAVLLLLLGGVVWGGVRLVLINSGHDSFDSYQMEICLDGDILYYCDHNREAALYAYNLKTEEEVKVYDKDVLGVYTDGAYLVFESRADDAG